MRRMLTAIFASFVLSLAFVSAAHAQTDAPAVQTAPSAQTDASAAQTEVNAGARAYKDGRFDEAEQHFRRALEIDPAQKNAQLFLARALQQQYKPGVETPENAAAGERAVAAYQEMLNGDPRNDDAYNAIVFLYGQMKREDKVVELLTERANNFSLPDGNRAQAFALLASKKWQCVNDITERKENQSKEEKPGGALVHYRMPADSADFYKARQCVDEGLQLAEQAVTLDPKSTSAWAYKANLLREASKLSEMEGDAAHKADFDRQYKEALDAQKRLRGEATQSEQAQQKTPAPAPTPAPKPKRATGSFAVLNGKAVSKPAPEYPAEAKAAGVQGTVSVRIEVDEAGNVTEAEALGGPAPLRDAAVAAARRAKFSQTRLSGRPVKVTGVVTYTFALR
jgi:TonB family protein